MVLKGFNNIPCCPIHGSKLSQKDGQYGIFYSCSFWPSCDIMATKSKFDKKFRLSNQALRDKRKETHACFDELWKSKTMSRKQAYYWLQIQMNISKKLCHVIHFNIKECDQVIELASNYNE